ncbi:beta-1,4-galactosyltransferase 7-like [Parasteatoda tepidariorum]|uniref:beta-1,4-galactosyltransferase 7-like n=1 Tax=Parasteatoda tepidariorum TaxID=114398 RepID=UPI001C723EDF|nr:beta-1,4-galactosyltransferase 7-like [Parasteatoda tepidariorum]
MVSMYCVNRIINTRLKVLKISIILACCVMLYAFILPKFSRVVYSMTDEKNNRDKHHLAVVVPFRNAFEELLQFAPHIHNFLNQQRIPHSIHVINQADKYRFNRGSLINVGYQLTRHICDYFAMHDVDLLPLNPKLSYRYPGNGPFHIASPELHPIYQYSTFVGGILILTNEHFELVNGLSNRYWGWGKEDDDFYERIRDANLNLSRPNNVGSGMYNTFHHIHDSSERIRDKSVYGEIESELKRGRSSRGLDDVQYLLLKTHYLVINQVPVVMHVVKLTCNITLTPWCEAGYEDLKD